MNAGTALALLLLCLASCVTALGPVVIEWRSEEYDDDEASGYLTDEEALAASLALLSMMWLIGGFILIVFLLMLYSTYAFFKPFVYIFLFGVLLAALGIFVWYITEFYT